MSESSPETHLASAGSADARAKLVLTSCDATRHGPPVAYDDEQHRQGPGVLWRMGNLGANAASDLAITMIVNSMSRGLKYSVGHSHDDDLDSVVLVGVVGVSNASSLGRLSLVKGSFGHDLPATWISPQRPWRYHDTPPHFRTWYSVPSRTVI